MCPTTGQLRLLPSGPKGRLSQGTNHVAQDTYSTGFTSKSTGIISEKRRVELGKCRVSAAHQGGHQSTTLPTPLTVGITFIVHTDRHTEIKQKFRETTLTFHTVLCLCPLVSFYVPFRSFFTLTVSHEIDFTVGHDPRPSPEYGQ